MIKYQGGGCKWWHFLPSEGVKELEEKVRWLESQVAGLEASNGQKQAMIAELKAQWSGALTNWTKNQQELVDQVQQARRQVDTLQLENASAKEVLSNTLS